MLEKHVALLIDASIKTRIIKRMALQLRATTGKNFFLAPGDIRSLVSDNAVVSVDEQATKRSRRGRFHGKNTSDVARQSAGPPRQLRANLFRLPGQFDD